MIKTIFDEALSDVLETGNLIMKEQAEKIFRLFKESAAFRWPDANNNCEDRANAICMLLDEWKISNGKGWVFSGYVFKKTGYLKNLWKYHVAALLPVREGGGIHYYIIDPSTVGALILLEDWAAHITDNPHSYYLIKKGGYYIFNVAKIERDNWFTRSRRNYNWTMQGLAGINGVTSKGRAQLSFNKKKVLKTIGLFKELKKHKPQL
jgi:hypothetical protein